MARIKLDVDATVSVPNVHVPMIRADLAATSNYFRVSFEVFLSLTGTLLGFVMGAKDVITFHYIVLALFALASAVSLFLSFHVRKPEKEDPLS